MLEYREDPINKIVELNIDGFVPRDDFNEVIKALELRIKEWGKLKLIKIVHDFDGFDPRILVDDIKFGLNHYKDFSHVALVSDKKWAQKLAEVFAPLYPCPIKLFEEDDLDDAREWLKSMNPPKDKSL